ncbi:MAG: hypothetical protein Satyrvirus23_5 [Satyrvirus sp.]|uniref:Uncharacterized protein n=1 Tax=Satyrvirus sp. TaxID=2487771 RepID=A0A3G5AEE8_9VIRU|nr:MAG: hypothetical protein Satyrvirus23_5 [Satyrvirus sp.]
MEQLNPMAGKTSDTCQKCGIQIPLCEGYLMCEKCWNRHIEPFKQRCRKCYPRQDTSHWWAGNPPPNGWILACDESGIAKLCKNCLLVTIE